MTDKERAAELYPYSNNPMRDALADARRADYLKGCEDIRKEMEIEVKRIGLHYAINVLPEKDREFEQLKIDKEKEMILLIKFMQKFDFDFDETEADILTQFKNRKL